MKSYRTPTGDWDKRLPVRWTSHFWADYYVHYLIMRLCLNKALRERIRKVAVS